MVLFLVKGATVFINYVGACMFYDCLFASTYFADTSRAHEVSTSKQHKSFFAPDVLKTLQLIGPEFADLIPPLQAELRGTLRDLYLYRCHIFQTLPCPDHPSNIITIALTTFFKGFSPSQDALMTTVVSPLKTQHTPSLLESMFIILACDPLVVHPHPARWP
jgi:hypothetical protein